MRFGRVLLLAIVGGCTRIGYDHQVSGSEGLEPAGGASAAGQGGAAVSAGEGGAPPDSQLAGAASTEGGAAAGDTGAGGTTVNDGGSASGGNSGAGGASGGNSGAGGASGGNSGAGGASGGNGGSSGAGGSNGGASGASGDAGSGGSSGSSCTPLTFSGQQYRHCQTVATFADAESACESFGMRLIRIDSSAENVWAAATLGDGWIGASDAATEGDWRWVDDTAFWSGDQAGGPVAGRYNAWSKNEPGASPASADCARFDSSAQVWVTVFCTSTRPYLCKAY